MDKEESNEELEINEVEELTEEEREIEGGATSRITTVSNAHIRIAKKSTPLMLAGGCKIVGGNIIGFTGSIPVKKGEKVSIVQFSYQGNIKYQGKPVTLIKYNGQNGYIFSEVIANSYPKK